MTYGILRAGTACPPLKLADCAYNASQIIRLVKEADKQSVRLLVFPELCITGYTLGDLFFQQALQEQSISSLIRIAKETEDTKVLFAVGLPINVGNRLYNAAAWVLKGRIIALIPKTFIPNYAEFYEARHFAPAPHTSELINLSDEYTDIPFSTYVLLKDKNDPRIVIGTEICEDLWTATPPSTRHALCGATLIANLSASNEVVGKAEYRRLLIKSYSARIISAYLYANSGHDESTTDMVFSAHSIIASNGSIVAEREPFCQGELLLADLDIERILQDRIKTTSFAASSSLVSEGAGSDYHSEEIELDDNTFAVEEGHATIGFSAQEKNSLAKEKSLLCAIAPHPFVPASSQERSKRCLEVINMQAEGLARRLRHIGACSAVIGLSGGLDSTLALLVTARAFDLCKKDRASIIAVTIPCFGTTERTYSNACALATSVGATLREIDIQKAVLQHFSDIGHNKDTHDVTYENSQARERTQVLMDVANKAGGIVIGTGDLSELALGWCTYNGDQMSMYGVNSSIPKTLVRYLVDWFREKAAQDGKANEANVLRDILETPVSPELLPPKDGTISQRTEDLVGPYELHDFFLYYMLRWGFSPRKIYFLACNAFAQNGTYAKPIILKWLSCFYRRFFSQQFKRSCMPDGAKVGTVSLSPRGDWRMPSDASATLWLSEIERMEQEAQ